MDRQTVERLEQLDRQGKEQLSRGEWEEAAETFRTMLELDDHPVLRNNLATAYYSGGRPGQAWEVLAPELDRGVFSPFAWALASMIAHDQGRTDDAVEYLKRAISLFEHGVRNPLELGIEPAAWREYTVIIKRAAGHLGDERLVVELHRSWERYYQTPEDLFQVGVAYFNLGQRHKAVKVWSRIKEHGWGFVQAYAEVAELMDRGVIPSFMLPYTAPDMITWRKKREKATKEDICRDLSHGGNRALFLGNLFSPRFPKAMVPQTINVLVSLGEWGLAFARSIFDSSSLPMEWKMAAGMALVDLGVIKPGEPVSMIVDGVETEVHLSKRTVRAASPAEKVELRKLARLFEKGEYELVRDRLLEQAHANALSLEGCQVLAKAHAALGEREPAETLANMFVKIGEEGNALGYLVAADIYLFMDEVELAGRFLEKCAYEELAPDARELWSSLDDRLRLRRQPKREGLE